MNPPTRPEPVVIAGPAGALEALVADPLSVPASGGPIEPQGASSPGFAVICHPHPLHGGSLHNKVVHTLARAFEELGLPTLRFNFRGVGASEGTYDGGRGELEDALAVIAWGQRRWPGAAVSLGGFSFGAMIALLACARVQPARLVCVAPPVSRPEFAVAVRPACPWLIVQGDADEIVDHRQVEAFAARFTPRPELTVLPGVDHFFHGRLRELQQAVLSFAGKQPGSASATGS